jgi:hypothetical protein
MSSFRFCTRTTGSTRRPIRPRTSSGPTPSSTYTDGVGASSGPPKHAAQVATRHTCCASPSEPPRALPPPSLGRGGSGCRIASSQGTETRRSRRIRWRRRNRSDKQQQPKQARPRSPSRRRRPRAGNETQTPRSLARCVFDASQALARKRQRRWSGDRKSFRRRSGYALDQGDAHRTLATGRQMDTHESPL